MFPITLNFQITPITPNFLITPIPPITKKAPKN